MRPAPPPKPSHLSVAITGTLSSDALRTYIRKQSTQTINSGKAPTPSTIRRLIDARDREQDDDTNGYEDDDDDDDKNVRWGTAKAAITPIKPAYANLADLFSPAHGEQQRQQHQTRAAMASNSSQATLKATNSSSRGGTGSFRTARGGSENGNGQRFSALGEEEMEAGDLIEDCDVSTFRLSKPRSRAVLPASSVFDIERSREPSVVSNAAFFHDDKSNPIAGGQLMHARDGSRFERAGPSTKSSVAAQNSEASGPALTPEPSQTSLLVAGPPPPRPSSMVFAPSQDEGSADDQAKDAQTPEICEPPAAGLNAGSSQVTQGGRSARALYAFAGEAHFNELSLGAGQVFEILNEDIGGGWSLAALQEDAGHWTKGLVPKGWYAYIQDFTLSPPTVEARKSSEPSPMSLDLEGPKTPQGKSHVGSSLHTMSPSTSSQEPAHSRNDSYLSPVQDWDRGRPASGIGEMSGSRLGAIQALNMVKSRSEGSQVRTRETQETISPANSTSSLPVSESGDTLASHASSMAEGAAPLVTPATTPGSPAPMMHREGSKKKATLLGGRSMNRFSPFVATGVEDYILFGSKAKIEQADGETARQKQFDIVTSPQGGPTWKSPGFGIYVEIHTPEVQVDERGREYIAFVVHASYTFFSEREQQDDIGLSEDPIADPTQRPASPTYMSSVYRRYNHFKWLSSHLSRVYPFFVLSLPPLPSANHVAGKAQRFEASFVEKRRRELQAWLVGVVRHPILRTDEAVRFFLETEHDGEEWAQGAKQINQRAAAASTTDVFSKTLHPLFGVDSTEAAIEAKQVAAFLSTYEKAMGADGTAPRGGVLGSWRDMREGGRISSDNYRNLSYALLRMMTGTALGAGTRPAASNGSALGSGVFPPMGNVGRRDEHGATNEQRAWCWRDGCGECKSLTKALQGTVDALQQVADLYDGHAHGVLHDEHDRLWNLSKAQSQHAVSTLPSPRRIPKLIFSFSKVSLGDSQGHPGKVPRSHW